MQDAREANLVLCNYSQYGSIPFTDTLHQVRMFPRFGKQLGSLEESPLAYNRGLKIAFKLNR